MAILLNGWIFPSGQSGEASRWMVCFQVALPRLVFVCPARAANKDFEFTQFLPQMSSSIGFWEEVYILTPFCDVLAQL